jgi:hypothetical protein
MEKDPRSFTPEAPASAPSPLVADVARRSVWRDGEARHWRIAFAIGWVLTPVAIFLDPTGSPLTLRLFFVRLGVGVVGGLLFGALVGWAWCFLVQCVRDRLPLRTGEARLPAALLSLEERTGPILQGEKPTSAIHAREAPVPLARE